MNYTDITPFEPLIFKSHFKWDTNIIKICEELINDSKHQIHLEKNNAHSSISNRIQPHTLPQFKPFYDWLLPIANDILYNNWQFPYDWKNVIGNSWVNVHEKGGFTDEHNHGVATLVVTAYINLPEKSGFIQFKDPMEYTKSIRPSHPSLNPFYKTVEAKSGDVIMFPGYIRHKTEESKSNEKRWVLTTNIISYKLPKTEKHIFTRDDR